MIYQIIEITDKNGVHCNDSDSNNNSSGNINNINDTNFMLVMKIDEKETLRYVTYYKVGQLLLQRKAASECFRKQGKCF